MYFQPKTPDSSVLKNQPSPLACRPTEPSWAPQSPSCFSAALLGRVRPRPPQGPSLQGQTLALGIHDHLSAGPRCPLPCGGPEKRPEGSPSLNNFGIRGCPFLEKGKEVSGVRLRAARRASRSHTSAFPLVRTSHYTTFQTLRTRQQAEPALPTPLAPRTEDPQRARARPSQDAHTEAGSTQERAPRPRSSHPTCAPEAAAAGSRCAHCITRPSPHPHAARPTALPTAPPAPRARPPSTYIIPLDKFCALLEAVGHGHGLELQSVHSGLSPGHLGSSGLRAARESAAGTGRGARAPFSAPEVLDSAPPPTSPGLPASAPPQARLSRRGTRGPGAWPCPGRDAGSGARGGCGASEGEEKPSPTAEAASRRRILLLSRGRLQTHHSAHPLYTEGERVTHARHPPPALLLPLLPPPPARLPFPATRARSFPPSPGGFQHNFARWVRRREVGPQRHLPAPGRHCSQRLGLPHAL